MVNFDPELIKLLREIRYLQLIDLHVPENGLLIYKNVDLFRDINMRLDQIVFMYNSIMSELIDVERPLLEKNISKMDVNLKPGLESFKWESNNILKEFINPCMVVVRTAYDIMRSMKGNMENIEAILLKQRSPPLIEKLKKTCAPGDFMTQHSATCESILFDMGKELKKIHEEWKRSYEKVKNSVDKESHAWKAYLD